MNRNASVSLLVAAGITAAAGADCIVYENGPWTGEMWVSSQLDTYISLDSAFADDFFMPTYYYITGARWYGGYYNGDAVPADWKVTIYEDGSDGPGAEIYSQTFSYAKVHETFYGYDIDGYANYSYEVHFSSAVFLEEGIQWISFQGVHDFPPQVAVSATSFVNYSEGYFGSNYFGYGYWVPGSAVFGAPFDIPFVLLCPAPSSLALFCLGGLSLRRDRPRA